MLADKCSKHDAAGSLSLSGFSLPLASYHQISYSALPGVKLALQRVLSKLQVAVKGVYICLNILLTSMLHWGAQSHADPDVTLWAHAFTSSCSSSHITT